MEKILVSSCLLGHSVRYDGKGHAILHPQLNLWQKQNRLIIFCPEVAGGLPTP
ncbi:2-thiouracil desulfurase family protein, partial [Psychrobacter sp. CAL346-MNA-CIBAN-0220]